MVARGRKGNAQERRSTETVGSVNSTGNFSRREESRNRLSGGVDDAGATINFKSSHGVMENRSHDGDVEGSTVKTPVGVGEAGSGGRTVRSFEFKKENRHTTNNFFPKGSDLGFLVTAT